MTNTARTPIIAVTSGESAGIGPDICLSLARHSAAFPFVVLGDIDLLHERAQQLKLNVTLRHWQPHQPLAAKDTNTLDVLHQPLAEKVVPGTLNPNNSRYVLNLLDTAFEGIGRGIFAAIVTAPVHKGVINDAHVPFSGHTEYLADKSGAAQVVMMLASRHLKVALVTTHLPLSCVSEAITRTKLDSVIRVLHEDLRQKFGLVQPRILVAGLNPHAGEGGHLGREEIDLIAPVIQNWQNAGVDIQGPFAADTIFQPFMLEKTDAVLCMYHDQGLPVLKFASFGHAVNITLGLPFIRTSVDHGTALEMAGSGKAHAGSLIEALDLAGQMITSQASNSKVFDQ